MLGDLLSDKMGSAWRHGRKGEPAAAFGARDGAISLLTLENIVSPGGTVSTQSGGPDAHLLARSRQGMFKIPAVYTTPGGILKSGLLEKFLWIAGGTGCLRHNPRLSRRQTLRFFRKPATDAI